MSPLIELLGNPPEWQDVDGYTAVRYTKEPWGGVSVFTLNIQPRQWSEPGTVTATGNISLRPSPSCEVHFPYREDCDKDPCEALGAIRVRSGYLTHGQDYWWTTKIGDDWHPHLIESMRLGFELADRYCSSAKVLQMLVDGDPRVTENRVAFLLGTPGLVYLLARVEGHSDLVAKAEHELSQDSYRGYFEEYRPRIEAVIRRYIKS